MYFWFYNLVINNLYIPVSSKVLLIPECVICNEVFENRFPATCSACSLLDTSGRFKPRDVILCFGKIKLGGSLQLTRCSVRVDMHSASGNQYMAYVLTAVTWTHVNRGGYKANMLQAVRICAYEYVLNVY